MAGVAVPAPVPHGGNGGSGTGGIDDGGARGRWRRIANGLRRSWPWVRYLLGLAVAAVALWAVLGQRGELDGVSSALDHLQPWWVVVGLAAEAGSYLSFATAQRRLLAVADVDIGVGPMAGIVLVATTITNSMPAGSVLSTVFSFRQFRRRGADDAVAAWSLVAVLIAAGASLALLAAVGLGVAGAEGAGDNLVGVVAAVVMVTLAGAVLLVQRRAVSWAVAKLADLLPDRWGRLVEAGLARLVRVDLSAREMAAAIFWTGGNWVLDCGCLVAAFLAVGAPVPWHGLLLAYGAGQLAANLPVTPGGLGLVEGSMTIALVAFGGDVVSTAVAVLVYRVMSFWIELPVGWVAWGRLVWRERRQDGDGTVETVVPGLVVAGSPIPGPGVPGATGSGDPSPAVIVAVDPVVGPLGEGAATMSDGARGGDAATPWGTLRGAPFGHLRWLGGIDGAGGGGYGGAMGLGGVEGRGGDGGRT